jgi:uncharacterized protein YecT (DUF1311 family)
LQQGKVDFPSYLNHTSQPDYRTCPVFGTTMHKSFTALLFAPVLFGCAKEPPKCSDSATVALVKEIVFDKLNLDAAAREKIGVTLLDGMLALENARPSGYDEKIKRFSCEATLVAKSDGEKGDSYRLPIQYQSQLDDKDDHIVALNGVLVADMRQLDMYLAAGLENAKKKAGGADNPAAPAAPAPVPEQPAQQKTAAPQAEPAPTSTGDAAGTVEQSGVCKGLDLAITMDQSECVSRRFTAADDRLNEEYKRVMASLSPDRQALLKSSQRAWIKDKETSCAAAGKEAEGGTLEPILIADCQVRMTEQRNTYLANYR